MATVPKTGDIILPSGAAISGWQLALGSTASISGNLTVGGLAQGINVVFTGSATIGNQLSTATTMSVAVGAGVPFVKVTSDDTPIGNATSTGRVSFLLSTGSIVQVPYFI